MSEFLGARISLISKSDIRYSGVLHEINSEQSTVSLENVRSFGTEGRKGRAEEELPPSEQVYEYIVFRGSDVKDLRIEQGPAAKESQPPAMPDDPAIVGARRAPAAPAAPGIVAPGPGHQQGPPGPPGPAGPPGFNPPPFQQPVFYPGPGGPWGRGGGGGPGPGPGPDPRFGGMGGMYPPPNWMPPMPGQGFPPNAPGPWNQFAYPPGPPGPPGVPGQNMRGTPQQEAKPTPIGAPAAPVSVPGSDRPKPASTPSHNEPPVESKSFGPPPAQPALSSIRAPTEAPTPPVESKPSVEEVKASAQSLEANTPQKAAQQPKAIPTGPKNRRVTPAVPSFPGGILTKQGPAKQPQVTAAVAAVKPAVPESSNGPSKEAAIRDATQQAREAVALAMANMNNTPGTAGPVPSTNGSGNAMDNLANKVNEMRVNAAHTGPSTRGRGRGNRAGGASKMDVPDSDFDFQTSNAKFNKQELVKEAIAGSPLGEIPNATAEPQETTDGSQPPAYNKTTSFFDNISSEAKDRADSNGLKPGGREWRGEEQRKNMETFGQGSVDGGYRPNYRGRGGRGRGRGGPPRGRGYSQSRGGGFRPRGESQGVSQ